MEAGGEDNEGRLLLAAAFLSTFERFAVAPMLVTIGADLQAPQVAAAGLYYLLYGLTQPVWGMLSDRLGRVMRLTLFAVLVPGLAPALAPNLATLVAARAVAGELFAAVYPPPRSYTSGRSRGSPPTSGCGASCSRPGRRRGGAGLLSRPAPRAGGRTGGAARERGELVARRPWALLACCSRWWRAA